MHTFGIIKTIGRIDRRTDNIFIAEISPINKAKDFLWKIILTIAAEIMNWYLSC